MKIGSGSVPKCPGSATLLPMIASQDSGGTAVLRIRIRRIHMFLGLPDPDPLGRGMNPQIRIRTQISWIRNTVVQYKMEQL